MSLLSFSLCFMVGQRKQCLTAIKCKCVDIILLGGSWMFVVLDGVSYTTTTTQAIWIISIKNENGMCMKVKCPSILISHFSLVIPIYLYIFTSPRGNSQAWASHIYGFICFCNFQWTSFSFALLGGSFHRLRKSCTFTHCYWTSHMLLSRHRQTFWFEYFYLRGKSLFWLDECSSLVGLIVICKICAYTMCIIIIIRTLKLHFM